MQINLRERRSLNWEIQRISRELLADGQATPADAKTKALEAVAINHGMTVSQLTELLDGAKKQTHRTIKVWFATYQKINRLAAITGESGCEILDRLVSAELGAKS